MALHTFRLPDPGEGLVEADIVTWRVAVGDQVKINDILVEVETSKSLVDLPTPYAGTVTELLVNEGETVDVGTPIISIDDGVDETSPAETNGGGEAQVPNLVGYGPRTGSAKRRPRRGAAGMDRWRRATRLRTPSPPMLRYHDAPTTESRYRPSRMRQPVPRCPGRVRRRPRQPRPVARYSPSRRCASWPRISVLILQAWLAAGRVV